MDGCHPRSAAITRRWRVRCRTAGCTGRGERCRCPSSRWGATSRGRGPAISSSTSRGTDRNRSAPSSRRSASSGIRGSYRRSTAIASPCSSGAIPPGGAEGEAEGGRSGTGGKAGRARGGRAGPGGGGRGGAGAGGGGPRGGARGGSAAAGERPAGERVGGPRNPQGTSYAVHPLASDREWVYRFSGGDTVEILRGGGRLIRIVKIDVTPKAVLPPRTAVFSGEGNLDLERKHVVRMRGSFAPTGEPPSGPPRAVRA